MPVTVLVWNLERLGDKLAGDLTGTAISQDLIAGLIADLGAHVVLIQELRSQGVLLLQAIVNRLNIIQPGLGAGNAWQFDWIKGGLATAGAPVTYADTSFHVTNSEGYAVLWKDGVVAPNGNRSAGAGHIGTAARAAAGVLSHIDLCLDGRTLRRRNQAAEPRLGRWGAGTSFSGFPTPACGTASKPVRTAKRRFAARLWWVGDPHVQVQLGSRRAVAITAVVPGAGGATYDIVGYHAPNSKFATFYGPLVAINATTPHPGQLTVAGDWNTTDTPARRALASTATAAPYGFTSPQINANGTIPGGATATMVHATRSGSSTWSTGAAVLTNHRDFSMNLPVNVQTAVPNVLYRLFSQALTNGQTFAALFLHQADMVQQLTLPAGNPTWPLVTRNAVTSVQIMAAYFNCWTTYLDTPATDQVSIQTGGQANFQTAFALLMNRYVSDHLPVRLTLL